MKKIEVINEAPVEKQVIADTINELHVHSDTSEYVKNFSEVESAIEQLPDELHDLLKGYGDLIKSHVSINDILNVDGDELFFPYSDDKRLKKLKIVWESWYLFLIYIALIKDDGNCPTIGNYIIEIDHRGNNAEIKVKHMFYTGEKNFEGLVREFLTMENAREAIRYDVYVFNNKHGLFPQILPKTKKEKIIKNISMVKSLSEELVKVKDSAFMDLKAINNAISQIAETELDLLKSEVQNKINEVFSNAIS